MTHLRKIWHHRSRKYNFSSYEKQIYLHQHVYIFNNTICNHISTTIKFIYYIALLMREIYGLILPKVTTRSSNIPPHNFAVKTNLNMGVCTSFINNSSDTYSYVLLNRSASNWMCSSRSMNRISANVDLLIRQQRGIINIETRRLLASCR